jgi:hypothetical protein
MVRRKKREAQRQNGSAVGRKSPRIDCFQSGGTKKASFRQGPAGLLDGPGEKTTTGCPAG